MPFYLRKSISVGPLRFNLSKSGVGISGGMRGLRVGAGPRGNYIHMGRHGLYYRATLPPGPSSARQGRLDLPSIDPTKQTHDELQEIESADATAIRDSSSAQLLAELDENRRKTRMLPIAVTVFGALVAISMYAGLPPWGVLLIVVAGGVVAYLAHQRDLLCKTTVLMYDFDPEMERAYDQFHTAALQMAECAAAWHIGRAVQFETPSTTPARVRSFAGSQRR